MNSLIGAFVLSFTVVGVVTTGILATYATVVIILQLLAPRNAETSGKPVLVTPRARAAHAGGD